MVQYKNRRVTVFESALFRTTSTIVETDDMVLLVDPNWLPQEVGQIRHYTQAIVKDRPLYLLFTHSDYDHIIGYKAFPQARVIASKAFVENPGKEGVIEQILQFDDDFYLKRDYAIAYPAVDILVNEDGQTLEIGGTKLTFYLAPGHNRDGIFTILETQSQGCDGAIWIAGDYLCNVEFPYIYYNSHAYVKTLSKTDFILSRHPVRLMVPGHGDVATSAEEILQQKEKALAYIHQLRQHVTAGIPFDLVQLWDEYRFPRLMKKFHESNIVLIKNEIEKEAVSLGI